MKKTLIIIVGLLIVSCSKNAPDLMELAQSSLDQNMEDDAIKNLDLLINKLVEENSELMLLQTYLEKRSKILNLLERTQETQKNKDLIFSAFPNAMRSDSESQPIDQNDFLAPFSELFLFHLIGRGNI